MANNKIKMSFYLQNNFFDRCILFYFNVNYNRPLLKDILVFIIYGALFYNQIILNNKATTRTRYFFLTARAL
jgi:hypothetical protein